MSTQLSNIKYVYSFFVNPKLSRPPVVAVHQIINVSKTMIIIDAIPIGIWQPDVGIIVQQLPEWQWQKPKIKRLSLLALQADGYTTDGIRTYYMTPQVLHAMIDYRP